MITYTHFNVLTLINWPKEDIGNTLNLLGISNIDESFKRIGVYQDYPIIIDSNLETNFTIDN